LPPPLAVRVYVPLGTQDGSVTPLVNPPEALVVPASPQKPETHTWISVLAGKFVSVIETLVPGGPEERLSVIVAGPVTTVVAVAVGWAGAVVAVGMGVFAGGLVGTAVGISVGSITGVDVGAAATAVGTAVGTEVG
jgi:hypothetical protein